MATSEGEGSDMVYLQLVNRTWICRPCLLRWELNELEEMRMRRPYTRLSSCAIPLYIISGAFIPIRRSARANTMRQANTSFRRALLMARSPGSLLTTRQSR